MIDRPQDGRGRLLPEMCAAYAAVALGAMIGGVLRALVESGAHDLLGGGFPWGTLLVNVAGSFAIGCYAALTGPGGRLVAGPVRRHFVMAGICGGFTTFSIFSLETIWLVHDGNWAAAGASVAVSVPAWLIAAWLGFAWASRLNRAPRRRRG